jgi:hypothetical protein
MRSYERCGLLNEFNRIVREHPLIEEFRLRQRWLVAK